MFEPKIHTHRPSRNDALDTQQAYLYTKGTDVLSSSGRRLKKILYSFFLGIPHYWYTRTVDSISFVLFISANRDGAVQTPV